MYKQYQIASLRVKTGQFITMRVDLEDSYKFPTFNKQSIMIIGSSEKNLVIVGIWQMNKLGPRMVPFTLISALTCSLHAEHVSEPRAERAQVQGLTVSVCPKQGGNLLFVKNIIHYAYH